MSAVKTYDESNAATLDGVNIIVYDSKGIQLFGTSSDKNGDAQIPDVYLSGSGNKIDFTRAEYNKLSVLAEKFNGNAFLKPKNVTLADVVVVAKKKKPITIVNPYDKKADAAPVARKKGIPVWVPVVGGGIVLALGIYYLTK